MSRCWGVWVLVLLVALVMVPGVSGRAAAQNVCYQEDFEGYAVGEHPDLWDEIWGDASDVVTDEWAESGTRSYVTVSPIGGWVKRDIIHLEEVGCWPLPDHFFYECVLHVEATPYSNGVVGFLFKDPRFGGQVAAENCIGFRADGRIEWGGPTDQVIGYWEPGKEATYRVRVEIDFPSLTADVWINGVLLGDDLPAYPRTIPADSVYGSAVPLDKWGFGVENYSGPGPGRLFIDDVRLGEYSPALEARVEVHPETLNLRSRGRFITAYIELPEGYDAADIDVDTVYLTVEGGEGVPAEPRPTAIRDRNRNGLPELMVKFDRQAVQALLEPGEEVTLYVGGQLTDGTAFQGQDTVRVLGSAVDVGEVAFHQQAAGANGAACDLGSRVFEVLTSRSPAGGRLRGQTRRTLRLIERLRRRAPSEEFSAALGAVADAVEALGQSGEGIEGGIGLQQVELYQQARHLADSFGVLAACYAFERRSWAGVRRTLRRGLDLSGVQEAWDIEETQLGLLAEAVAEFRTRAAALADPEQAQALADLADAVQVLITSLGDYLGVARARVVSW